MFFNKKKPKYNPEVYTEAEMDAVEAHIEQHFGAYSNVFHELVSPDIHVDICIIDPTPERNYYTLVTMGMGAHRMEIPEQLKAERLERAELAICLPPGWEIHNNDEQWYWPLRWLKVLARLPGEEDTWLGYGHTVPNGGPFAENTKLCCMLLTQPYLFGEKAANCEMPDGSRVVFYQLLPLYESEVQYKLAHNAEALEALFGGELPLVLDVGRDSIVDS